MWERIEQLLSTMGRMEHGEDAPDVEQERSTCAHCQVPSFSLLLSLLRSIDEGSFH